VTKAVISVLHEQSSNHYGLLLLLLKIKAHCYHLRLLAFDVYGFVMAQFLYLIA
jgi:hypothetical protein